MDNYYFTSYVINYNFNIIQFIIDIIILLLSTPIATTK